MNRTKLNVLKIAKLLVISLAISSLFGSTLNAQSSNSFSAGRIIDDSVFFNSGSMSVAEIQVFLNSKVPTCETNHPQGSYPYPPPYICLKEYSTSTDFMPADSFCKSVGGGVKSAPQIIKEVAEACSVSPKVLLVLLQKEQILVTDTWPLPSQYTKATGFACPDSDLGSDVDANNNNCYDAYEGFFKQVYYGARQYQRYAKQPNLYNFRAGQTTNILFNPNTSCGSSVVTLQNQATAGLYNYTPYQPNSGSLSHKLSGGRYYSTAYPDCGAYGNINFWLQFRNWFGSSYGDRPVLINTTHPDGTLIKDDGANEVYKVISQTRYHVKDMNVFNSNNFRWSDVKSATLKDKTLNISSTSLTYKSGTIVRSSSGTSIYFLRCNVDTCSKHHIVDLNTFLGLGYEAKHVMVIDPSEVNAMSEGAQINSSLTHPQDSLVLDTNTGKVYIIGIGYKHWIPNLGVFTANNYGWSNVLRATSSDLALPESSVYYNEGALVRQSNSPSVYVVDQDQYGNYSKRFIVNQTVFAGLGYSPSDVFITDNLPGPNGLDLSE